MIFKKTKLADACVIELAKHEDDRGFLARTWDKVEFEKQGIFFEPVQGYVSYTAKKGTIRGIHYQVEPAAEAKLMRCTKGRIFEVIIDLKPNSPTYKKWQGFEFGAADCKMLFIPKGFGHAILTLEDNCEFQNFSNQPHTPEFERGIRFNDPALKIKWPIAVKIISQKDKSWEDFDDNSR